jgi:solute carrier family 25 2-oxodicarboxylate transporter 21
VCAGLTEAFLVVPFELVKIRLQDKSNAGKYSNTMDAVVKIAKSEGILTFYKGLESTLWRHVNYLTM